MYPFAYVVIIIGIAVYYIFPTPEPVIDNGAKDGSKPYKKRSFFGFWYRTIYPNQPDDVERTPTERLDNVSFSEEGKA